LNSLVPYYYTLAQKNVSIEIERMLVTKIFTLPFTITTLSKTSLFGVGNDYLSDLSEAPVSPSPTVVVEPIAEPIVEPSTSSIKVDIKSDHSSEDVEIKTTGEKENNVNFEMTQLVGEIDADALFEASTFPISPQKLISRAKEVLNPEIKLGMSDDGACLADDFEFVAAVVGPIGKKEYISALASFQLEDNFDITPNFFGFSVDPMQTNRVWFFNRQEATQTKTFMGAEPTDKKLVLPVQTYHIDFNEQGQIKEFGFYTTDRRSGNTGGLGGAFGYFYGVGKPLPIPECQPYKKSKRFRLLNLVGTLMNKFK